MSTETDRYGNPLEPATIEQIIEDLVRLPVDMVIAICAALIVAYEPYTWGDKIKLFASETDAN